MKQMIKPLIFLLAVLTFIQCKDKTPEEAALDKLFDEVMVVHDDVMPKTATIHRLKKKLKNNQTDENASSITVAIQQLDIADEGMMQWMEDFKKPKNKPFEEAKAYYENEKVRITKVKKDIHSAISIAEELIPKQE